MRAGSRWQEWVIVVAILALTGIGVTAIWGGDLARVFGAGAAQAESQGAAAGASAVGPQGRTTGTF